jgi:Response regulators consisting of a CheY-like receiver domain and a winged-helix DNA-binding domain
MSKGLTPCPSIGTHQIQRNDESRVLIVDQIIVRFTPIEYQIVSLLLNTNIVNDAFIVQKVFDSEMSSSLYRNLEKHIDKLRWKLRPAGLNIHRVSKYGYVLLAALD